MSRFFADPYFGRVVGGLMSVLRPAGVQLALQIVGTEEARTRLVGDLRQGQADGVGRAVAAPRRHAAPACWSRPGWPRS